MFEKMIAQQTAKKVKLLDDFLKKHEAEYPFPEDVELIRDIDYMGDGKPCHFMDIYRPKHYEGRLPIMFNLHGGGFLLGKKEEGHLFCAEMSQRGFLVFSFEYPLAPEASFPQILKDLMTGIGNARAYFETYDGDESCIYMTGTSAGARLCVHPGTRAGKWNVLHNKTGQYRDFSPVLYLWKAVEKELVLSLY